MEDILNAASELQWSDKELRVEEIEENFGLPQIVKVSYQTSVDYDLPEDEAVLLVCRRNPIRLIAQTVEEGHYVMGKQVEIPSEYSGLFKLSNDYDREDIPLQTFRSIQEVCEAFPPRIYVQEQLTVTLASDDSTGKFTTVVLEKGDELLLVNRLEPHSAQGIISKPASRFISRVRRLQHTFLIVHCSRLDEKLSLPMSIQGWFSTRPPLFVHLSEKKGIISLQQIMEQADFPLTVIVSTNSTRSVKDEFVLRTGMHLKMLGLEEHHFVLGVTSNNIIEFAASGPTFRLSAALTNMGDNSKEHIAVKNQYQTYVQSAFMTSKLQNNPCNVDDYCTSVRYHIQRHRRLTNPQRLNNNAFLRSLTLGSQHHQRRSPTSNHGVSAIQLLTQNSFEGLMQRDSRSSSRRSSLRRQLPTPDPPGSPSPSNDTPPLPPRNSPLPHNPAMYGNFSPNNYPHNIPPVPPKNRFPPPPNCEPLSLSTIKKTSSDQFADVPIRQAPLPNIPDPKAAPASQITNGHNPCEEESIWCEFVPRAPVPANPPISNMRNSEGALSSYTANGSQSPTFQPSTPVHQPAMSTLVNIHNSGRSDSPSFALAPSPQRNADPREVASAGSPNNTLESLSKTQTTVPETTIPEPVNEPNATSPAQASSSESSEENRSLSSQSHAFSVNGVEMDTMDLTSRSGGSSCGQQSQFSKPSKLLSKKYVAAPATWQPPDDVATMNVEEVTKSLRYIGLNEKVVQFFRNEMIDGVMLVELSDEILEEDFHLNKLYRFKLRRFIQGWRPKLPQP